MLLLLAIDSQFAMTETVIVCLNDLKYVLLTTMGCGASQKKRYRHCNVCFVSWLIGFVFVCRAGYYVISVIDGLNAGFGLLSGSAAQMICDRIYGPKNTLMTVVPSQVSRSRSNIDIFCNI